jgi:hypothetical protein
MAAGPLSSITPAAGSVADDLSYVALADISRAFDAQTTDYRVMVTALAVRWDLGASLYRETLDADVGVPPIVARDLNIAGRLKAAGYKQVAGDRFERPVPDVPAGLPGRVPAVYRAVVDVLVPAYTSRARQNVKVGPDLVTTEVHGLQLALARAPVEMALDLRRLNGDLLRVRRLFPDEISALTLKALATSVRMRPTDIIDVWRAWRSASQPKLILRPSAAEPQLGAQRSSGNCSTAKPTRACGRSSISCASARTPHSSSDTPASGRWSRACCHRLERRFKSRRSEGYRPGPSRSRGPRVRPIA